MSRGPDGWPKRGPGGAEIGTSSSSSRPVKTRGISPAASALRRDALYRSGISKTRINCGVFAGALLDLFRQMKSKSTKK